MDTTTADLEREVPRVPSEAPLTMRVRISIIILTVALTLSTSEITVIAVEVDAPFVESV